jgi:hypothetical protein
MDQQGWMSPGISHVKPRQQFKVVVLRHLKNWLHLKQLHFQWSYCNNSIMGSGSDLVDGADQCHFARSVAHSEVTSRRPQAVIATDRIDHPSIARANMTVSTEKPEGNAEYTKKYQDYVCR